MGGSDRPWPRKLIKLMARLALGRNRAHWQDFWPGLRILTTANGSRAVVYRGKTLLTLASPAKLKSRTGDLIVIVGSGPSVAASDLTKIPPGAAILLNGAISLIHTHRLVPLALAIEDERFIHRHFAMLQWLGRDPLCLFSVSALRAIAEKDADWLAGRNVILIDDVRKPYHMPARSSSALNALPFAALDPVTGAGFSADPDQGVFGGGSVAVSALQFAIACAPKEIGFLGVDIANAGDPRFYEPSGKAAKSGILAGQTRILAHIDLARRMAQQSNIRLISFSPASALLKCAIAYDSRFQRPEGG